MIGAAIIDAHDDGMLVAQIGHARVARQRHGRMRGGDAVAVINLAIGGAPAVEGVAVPGSEADGGIFPFARHIGLPGDRIGVADQILAAALGHGFTVGDDARAGPAVNALGEIFLAVALRHLLRRLGAARHGDDAGERCERAGFRANFAARRGKKRKGASGRFDHRPRILFPARPATPLGAGRRTRVEAEAILAKDNIIRHIAP
jgi:hypothetical protein